MTAFTFVGTDWMSGGPQAEEWNFGRPVHGYVWRAPDHRGTVILQHGYAEYSERYVAHYSHLIPQLVRLGLTVRAFDMRGHGQSPGKRGVTDIEVAVADHLAARRAATDADVGPLFLMGHSLGGLVTAASVVREGAGIAGTILSSAALLSKASTAMTWIARTLAATVPGLGLLPSQSPTGLSRLPAEVDAFRDDPHIYRGKLPVILASSALTVQRLNWGLYADWTVPTLIFHGTDDSYTDINGSRLFAGLIASTDKELRIVSGGRHEMLNDIGREQLLDHVLAWVDKRAGAAVAPGVKTG